VLVERINQSRGLDTPEMKATYSQELRGLVQECMLRAPLLSPSSVNLVQQTRAGLDAAAQALDSSRIMPNLSDGVAQVLRHKII
jgi:hypothetical protein